MPPKKSNYEDKFSPKTKSIIMTLNNIFLDSGYDVREKHMFGHKAYLLRGHMFMIVGEWARKEKPKELSVEIAARGPEESTIIVVPLDEAAAEKLRKKYGGLYFAPSGTRLKNWLSLTGPWLYDEDKLVPLMRLLLKSYEDLPQKVLKNPGRSV